MTEALLERYHHALGAIIDVSPDRYTRKWVHRHADPITTEQLAESVVQK